MKKVLLPLLFSCLAMVSVRADFFWYEGFDYVNGRIDVVGTNAIDGSTNWFRHSGTGNDAFLNNKRLEIAASSPGVLARTDDVNRRFPSAYTNSQITVFASFTVACTNLPDADGGYFAHFMGLGGNQLGRVYAILGSLPGTWRLGIAAAGATANQIFPVDLALNTDYQVVVAYDPVAAFGTLWVDPLSSSSLSRATSDPVTGTGLTQIIGSFAFRQAGSFGNAFFNVTNLATATTFDEAATNVWNLTPVAPIIVRQPLGGTNFVGNSVSLNAVAAGQNLAALTYQWRKDGADIANPDGNTNVLTIPSAVATDSGAYTLVVSDFASSLSVTSTVANLWVTNPPVAPTITQHPTNKTVYFGQTAVFNVAATGTGLSYAWYYNNSPVSSPNVSGDGTPTLTVADVRTNNGTAGTYRCDVSNTYGTTPSSNAVLSAVSAPAVSIGFLRTLVDPTFFLPTNTTALWSVTGIVTTHTNITTSDNSSFYIQDDTGGINVFFDNSTGRPAAGDNVTVTGPLGQFNSLLEMNLTTSDPAHSIATNSSGNLLPPGQVLPFSFTNGVGFGGVGESIRKFQGAVVTLTNVYFANVGGTFAGGLNYVTTNQAGETFSIRVDARVFDIIGQPIPEFAWKVTGPMAFFLGTGVADRSAGYQILPTRYADIVTAEPPAVTGAISLIGGQPTITWTAQPYMSYSILQASVVAGPYVPLITGLTFNTAAGQYTETNSSPATRFYKIVSP